MKEINLSTQKLYDLLHTLGKKWSIELMHLVKKGSKSYSELQKELGINSKLVSTKIKELIELNILKKEGDRYDLSKLGKKVFKKIKPLTKLVTEFAEELQDDFNKGVKVATKKMQVATKTTQTIAKKIQNKVAPKKVIKTIATPTKTKAPVKAKVLVKAKAPVKAKVLVKKPVAKAKLKKVTKK